MRVALHESLTCLENFTRVGIVDITVFIDILNKSDGQGLEDILDEIFVLHEEVLEDFDGGLDLDLLLVDVLWCIMQEESSESLNDEGEELGILFVDDILILLVGFAEEPDIDPTGL